MKANNWFTEARYGLYSLLERGEWGWNREENRSGRIQATRRLSLQKICPGLGVPETEDLYLKELNK